LSPVDFLRFDVDTVSTVSRIDSGTTMEDAMSTKKYPEEQVSTMTKRIGLREARRNLGALVRRAQYAGESTIVEAHGRPAAMVVPYLPELDELLAECRSEAERQGAPRSGWEPTAEDLEWICAELGRKPSREEWTDAGWPLVASCHCAE